MGLLKKAQKGKGMGLLKKAQNEQAYLKAGMLGFPGSGKTFTATMLSIAIAKLHGENKPVAFFDTETGSDYVVRYFEDEGIDMLSAKSSSFADLMTVAREAEKTCCVLIVDSISHVWRELCEAYQQRRKVSKLGFQHWADIKREWAEWTKFYLNSKLHIFVLGRAGYEYDMETGEDGKKELIKAGTKMKVESEFGFEPSLLIEMERVSKGAAPGSGWLHRAHILKDRTDTVNGMAFDFEKPRKAYKEGDWQATYRSFAPIFKQLNIGGAHRGIEGHSSADLFPGPSGESARAIAEKRKEIALEEIKHSLGVLYPGATDAAKKARAAMCEELIGVRVWPAVEMKPMQELELAARRCRWLEGNYQEAGAPENDEDMKRRVTLAITTVMDAPATVPIEEDDVNLDPYPKEAA